MAYKKQKFTPTTTSILGRQFERGQDGKFYWVRDDGVRVLTNQQKAYDARKQKAYDARNKRSGFGEPSSGSSAMDFGGQVGNAVGSYAGELITGFTLALIFIYLFFRKDENGHRLVYRLLTFVGLAYVFALLFFLVPGLLPLLFTPVQVSSIAACGGVLFALTCVGLTWNRIKVNDLAWSNHKIAVITMAVIFALMGLIGAGMGLQDAQNPRNVYLSSLTSVSSVSMTGDEALADGTVTDLAVDYGGSTDWGIPSIVGTITNSTENDWEDVTIKVLLITDDGPHASSVTIASVPAGTSSTFKDSGGGEFGGMIPVGSADCQLDAISFTSMSTK